MSKDNDNTKLTEERIREIIKEELDAWWKKQHDYKEPSEITQMRGTIS